MTEEKVTLPPPTFTEEQVNELVTRVEIGKSLIFIYENTELPRIIQVDLRNAIRFFVPAYIAEGEKKPESKELGKYDPDDG